MRSGTSFFDWTLFKKTVTQFWPLWAVYLAGWLLAMPLSILTGTTHNLPQLLQSGCATGLIIALLYTPLCAMAVLSPLYNSRSANFFGALPVRREGIFLTRYTAGLAFSLGPNVLVGLLTWLAALLAFEDTWTVFLWLGTMCVYCLFFYTLAILCGMLTGHILALPCFYAALNGAAIALYALLIEIFRDFYWGFKTPTQGFLLGAVEWLTPASKLSEVTWRVYEYDDFMGMTSTDRLASNARSWTILAVYAVAALILGAGAFLLYKHRRLETAGDVVAVAPLRPVFKYLVALYSGLLLGSLTQEILGEVTLIPGTILWALVGYFAGQMFLDKSFRVFRKWKGALAVAAVFGVFFLVLIFDLTGYETRIPEPEDVESLEVESFAAYGLGDTGDTGGFTLTDPDQISRFVALHRIAIDQRNDTEQWETASYDPDMYDMNKYSHGTLFMDLTYHTTHGTFSRLFQVTIYPWELDQKGSGAQVLESIFTDRELYRHIYGFDVLDEYLAQGGRIDSATYYYRGSYNYDGYYVGEPLPEEALERSPELAYEYFRYGNSIDTYNQSQIMALYEAVERDWQNGNIGVRHVVNMEEAGDGEERQLSFYFGPEQTSYYLVDHAVTTGTRRVTVTVMPQSEETLKVLFEVLPEVMEEHGLEMDLRVK